MITITGSKSISIQQRPSLVSSFISWAANQEEYRLTWLAVTLSVHGCFITPFTVMTVMATTQNLAMFMIATGAMAMTLVANLAALPTKITIPVFLLSIIIELAIVGISIGTIL